MKLVRSALVVAAALTVPLVPTAAHADRYIHVDATQDVVKYVGETVTPAPEQADGDIAYTKVRHRAHSVVLTIRYRELNPGNYKVHYFAIRTAKMRRFVSLVSIPGHSAGKVLMTTAKDKKVRCHVTRKIDYTANSATVWVPRSCLGKPRWVKVGIAALDSDTSNLSTAYIDDARTTGNFSSPAWSPRVYR